MKLTNYKWYILVGAIAIVVTFAGYRFVNQEEALEEDLFIDAAAVAEEELPIEETAVPQEIKVDVKGAVLSPGLYMALGGERVFDLVEKAGGFTAEADRNRVNLAQIVEDQMVIYVPVIGEEGENMLVQNGGIGSLGTSNANAQEGQKVNLNTADETELQTLTGVGPSKAAAIIQYRTENGPFQKIEDLKNISGIGEKTFEKLKEDIAI
ncbi:MAG: helix-hairpin-helix domain-containing protein [Bacillus sp. (in: firmicutes)]